MDGHRLAGRVLAGLATITLAAGCATGTATPGPSASASPSEAAATHPPSITAAPPPAAPSPSPAAANEWPFVRSSCPEASGQPLLLVALGTSETAGSGIRTDEPYSPQEAYPAQYADILCKKLGVPVDLHSYFPSPLGSGLAPLAWWNERVAGDSAIRADLAAAGVVVLWAMSSHNVVPALVLGACSGDWPDPLKACFEAATAKIPAQTDELFGAISKLVPKGVTVLAADAYLPPAVLQRWAGQPYWQQLKPMIDPRPATEPFALRHGFTFVDTEAAFNGPTGTAMPADGLFQADGLHPTAAGALAVAKVFAKADGIGD
jgi:hypothetical protein